ALADGEGLARCEEEGVGGGDLLAIGCDLAERAHVVEHPEAAAVGGDGEVIAVDDDVPHGGDGHVELEWMPVVAVVEGDVDAELGGGVEEALLFRVFADAVDEGAAGDAARD